MGNGLWPNSSATSGGASAATLKVIAWIKLPLRWASTAPVDPLLPLTANGRSMTAPATTNRLLISGVGVTMTICIRLPPVALAAAPATGAAVGVKVGANRRIWASARSAARAGPASNRGQNHQPAPSVITAIAGTATQASRMRG